MPSQSSVPPPAQRRLGDADVQALFNAHRAEILRYAARCVGRREVAEEITNEAFLRLVQRRDEIEGERAASWLMAIVKNLAADYWRRQAVERKHAHAAPPPAAPPGIHWKELLREPSLKAEHRVCLVLHYVHGMDRKEIVSHTGLTENQVKSCLQYGLTLLRKAIR